MIERQRQLWWAGGVELVELVELVVMVIVCRMWG